MLGGQDSPGPEQFNFEDIAFKYSALEILMKEERGHDDIIAHIERHEITPEESSPAFYETTGYRVAPPLFLAVEFGRPDIMNSLIQKGFNPHTSYTTQQGRHLHLILEACTFGNLDIIKALVDEHHVDLNVVDSDRDTAIVNVLNSGIVEDEMLEVVKYLVENGADVTNTADLAAAVSRDLYKISEYLISCGGLLCAKSPNYWSPLAYAARSGNVKIAKLLVKAGANTEGSEGKKLSFVAAVHNHVEMVDYFNSLGIDLDCKYGPYSVLKHTIRGEAHEVTRYLVVDANVSLERKGSTGRTAFDEAFRRKFVDIVRLFVKAGYNPINEACLNREYTPVQFAEKVPIWKDLGFL